MLSSSNSVDKLPTLFGPQLLLPRTISAARNSTTPDPVTNRKSSPERPALTNRDATVLPNLASRKLAFEVLGVATMVGIFHAAGRCRRWFSRLLMHCVAKPAHDFFGEEIDLDWVIVENNIIPHTEAFLRDRKIHSDPLAAVQDIKDRFDRHLRYLSEDDPMLVISA